MPSTKPYIFVSHASKDDATVTRLCDELMASTGRDLWVDHKNIATGANWQIAIDTSLREKDAMLLAMSRNSADREEVIAEWRDALLRKHDLFIAIIDDIPIEDIPSRLRIIQMVNLHTDWNAGIRTLTAAIKGEPLPDDAPLTPARPMAGHIDRRLTTIPIIGRDDDLNEVKRLLKIGPAAILGIGGLGKSRLAAELAMTSSDVDGAMWHTASDISRPDEVIELLRDHLNLEVTADRSDVLKKLRTVKRMIVLDNMESVPADNPRRAAYVKLIDDLVDAGAQVLLTSRVEWPDLERCGAHTLHTLTPESAAQVVPDMGQAENVSVDLKPQAMQIAQAARFHPRLIEWAVGLMKTFPVQKVIEDMTDLKSKSTQDALNEMILKTLNQMTKAHGKQPEIVLKRLNVCRSGFTYEAAKALIAPSLTQTSLDDALVVLRTYTFLTFGDSRYTIDPLVITAVGEDPAAHRPHYDHYSDLALAHYQKQDYLGLDPESANLEAAFEWALATGDGTDALRIANRCAPFLANRGRFKLRLDWFERLENKLSAHPNKDLRADSLNGLGVMYREYPFGKRQKNLQKALESFKTTLTYWTDKKEHAGTQNNIGLTYVDLASIEDPKGNLQQGMDAYEEALKIWKRKTEPEYAMVQNNLGEAYVAFAKLENPQDNLAKALDCYQKALKVYKPTEDLRLDYAMVKVNLGDFHVVLAEITNDWVSNFPLAYAAYVEALKYYTLDEAPLEYAKSQYKLGLASLKFAISSWRDAKNSYKQLGHITDSERLTNQIATGESIVKKISKR
ncbi:MAG: toll/interleukin-1 receptor domain-containing protein [Anaerolineae bacterium]|nr:toll/interleukin-1 receptor domain-containing protein [Anaerolineae bacterium]